MAVLQSQIYAALQECGVAYREGKKNLYFKNVNGGKGILPIIDGQNEKYKINEIRQFVTQLHLDKSIVRKHIPEL